MPIPAVNTTLAVLTVIGQVIVLLVALALLLARRQPRLNALVAKISEHALTAAFVTALTAMLGSLYYSEIAGYAPCILCWYQRIAMYPQALLLGIATWRKDRNIIDYCLALSVVGGLIAGFHYREQISATPLSPCSAVGYSVSCAERFVTHFGYITIPLMAFTAFAMIIVFLLALKRQPAQKTS